LNNQIFNTKLNFIKILKTFTKKEEEKSDGLVGATQMNLNKG
jgi:hypothetical protein